MQVQGGLSDFSLAPEPVVHHGAGSGDGEGLSAVFTNPLQFTLQHLTGAEVDLTKSDEEKEDNRTANRKKLGIPEMDPDALPSSCINKYLTLI